MKKIILSFTMFMLVASMFFPGLTAGAASDIKGHMYEAEIRELMALGVLTGYEDGTIRPENEVTRAEFAKMVIKSLELDVTVEGAEVHSAALNNITFKDVSSDDWFYEVVSLAVELGIVNGVGNDMFAPNMKITREQMASMVARALQAKGVNIKVEETAKINYKDNSSIMAVHFNDVRILSHLKILEGSYQVFSPKDNSKRWMVALVMLRARDQVFPPVEEVTFDASSIKDGKTNVIKKFKTFAEAKTFAKADAGATLVESTNRVLWMENGIAVSNAFATVYPSDSLTYSGITRDQFRPYVTLNTEMKYLDSTDKYVKVELAGEVGFVDANVMTLIPHQFKKGQSYYEVSNGQLVHRIFNHFNESYTSTGVIGKAPAEFAAGAKYYSWDGSTFTDASGKTVTESHQYFNKLPLHTVSNYTAEELDKYLADKFPYYGQTAYGKKWINSPLVGSGKFYKEMEQKYKINALYLMAHAIHESAWGTSKIAQDKFNLFGYGAVDSDPYRGAYTYPSFRESIEDAAKRVNTNYHTLTGFAYNGSFLGNKSRGMNVRYASDPYWGEKIAGHMYRADLHLDKKDFGKETLGMTTTENLAFRSGAGTNNKLLYRLIPDKISVVIKGESNVSGATWYKVQSEDKQYQEAFVFGKGQLLGKYEEYTRLLPVAK